MSSETKIIGIIVLLSVVLIGGGVFFLSRNQSSTVQTVAEKPVNINLSLGQKVGSDSAKIKLVEFSDLQCPACLAAEPAVKEVRETYKNDLQFIYRHFPLSQHKFSKVAANAAEYAAKEGKFWEMHDRLFETQTEWSVLPDATDYIVNLGKGLGLDADKLRQAIMKEEFAQRIQEDVNEGTSLGVNSTPTFFVNGKKVNLKNFADLKGAISSQL